MKRRTMTEVELERKARRQTVSAAVFALLVLLSVLATGKVREYRLRRVIYDYERATDYAVIASDSSEVVKVTGRPNKAHYQLERRPCYPRFWDRY